ncbi:FimB/Mfa2 family fimbrial subunit [Parabacteroides chongii]|uniref:FimB/Mfa2 family fimbrial subunit n=1 Tax=Parabacteroides chongii TaxID=2685834 RepID=UPI00240D7806|nr:FimB/Mfa2 family fimbrial subunit [Parabacteroides chongii]WFE83009.1 FimB/Mfa2 family fimbrial subunit [Parabacteroides chongii]
MMIAGMGLTACDYFSDDSLKPCEYRLHFVYDYNMKFADAFQHEVERATLFICDNKGNYIMQQDFNGNALKANNIKLDLEPGTYYTVTWAGLSEQSYSMPELTPGTTTLQDLRLRTLREADATQRDELSPLWHSLDTLVITRDKHEDKTISLAKNTNKLRFVLQDTDGNCMDVRDFTFEIKADNGYMDYDNSLLEDPVITYLPYMTKNVNIAEGDSIMGKPAMQTVAVAEMNTMRLMAGENYRLIVRHKDWEKDVLNINLNNYLLLTQMEGHAISAQEYLDRQDEYSIVFFLTPTYCPDCPDPKPDPDPEEPDPGPEDPDPEDPDPENPDKPDPEPDPDPDPDPVPDPDVPIVRYTCLKVQVKDWVIRINQGEL